MEAMVMVNERRLEILKVFYALFTTLIDEQHSNPPMTDAELLTKLRQLSAKLKNQTSEHGTLN